MLRFGYGLPQQNIFPTSRLGQAFVKALPFHDRCIRCNIKCRFMLTLTARSTNIAPYIPCSPSHMHDSIHTHPQLVKHYISHITSWTYIWRNTFTVPLTMSGAILAIELVTTTQKWGWPRRQWTDLRMVITLNIGWPEHSMTSTDRQVPPQPQITTARDLAIIVTKDVVRIWDSLHCRLDRISFNMHLWCERIGREHNQHYQTKITEPNTLGPIVQDVMVDKWWRDHGFHQPVFWIRSHNANFSTDSKASPGFVHALLVAPTHRIDYSTVVWSHSLTSEIGRNATVSHHYVIYAHELTADRTKHTGIRNRKTVTNWLQGVLFVLASHGSFLWLYHQTLVLMPVVPVNIWKPQIPITLIFLDTKNSS